MDPNIKITSEGDGVLKIEINEPMTARFEAVKSVHMSNEAIADRVMKGYVDQTRPKLLEALQEVLGTVEMPSDDGVEQA